MGQPAESKEAAYHVYQWLHDCGGYALIQEREENRLKGWTMYGKNKVF